MVRLAPGLYTASIDSISVNDDGVVKLNTIVTCNGYDSLVSFELSYPSAVISPQAPTLEELVRNACKYAYNTGYLDASKGDYLDSSRACEEDKIPFANALRAIRALEGEHK